MSRIVMGAALALAVGGCARGAEVQPDTGSTAGEMMIYVENRQWNDMDILVEGAIGGSQFLGTVSGRATGVFQLPAALLHGASQIRLIADPHESTQRIISEPLEVGQGHSAQWELRKSGLSRLRFR